MKFTKIYLRRLLGLYALSSFLTSTPLNANTSTAQIVVPRGERLFEMPLPEKSILGAAEFLQEREFGRVLESSLNSLEIDSIVLGLALDSELSWGPASVSKEVSIEFHYKRENP